MVLVMITLGSCLHCCPIPQVRKKLEARLFLAKPDFCFTMMDLAVSTHSSLSSLPVLECVPATFLTRLRIEAFTVTKPAGR